MWTNLVIQVGYDDVVDRQLYPKGITIGHGQDPGAVVQKSRLHEGQEGALGGREASIFPLGPEVTDGGVLRIQKGEDRVSASWNTDFLSSVVRKAN